RPHLVALLEQRRAAARPGRGQVADDLGQLVAVGAGGRGPGLGLGDAAGGDELHRLADLLRGLDRPEAPAQLAFLAAGHGRYSPLGAAAWAASAAGSDSAACRAAASSAASSQRNCSAKARMAPSNASWSGRSPVSRMWSSRSRCR